MVSDSADEKPDNLLTIGQGEANLALLTLLRTWFCGLGGARWA